MTADPWLLLKDGLRKRNQQREWEEGLYRFLMKKGICRSLAQELVTEFLHGDYEDLRSCLKSRLRVSPPPSFPARWVFIGPTGVGKSTALLKLASYFLEQPLRIAIVDLEENGRLAHAAHHWNIPYSTSLSSIPDVDLLLIDTPGCNYYLPQRIEALADLLATLPKSEILLTLSATTKDIDLYGAIHQFSCLEPTGLIFTKLDETLAKGFLLNICQKTPYPLRYIGYGYPLPGSIEPANPEDIIQRILEEVPCKEIAQLRDYILE